jgi:uncharacterized protein YndB with AHSA1/START domain
MREQEAKVVIAAPIAQVESLLTDVTLWPTFLVGLESAERLGHERYRFRLVDGRDRREVVVCVRHDLVLHRFSWKALEGPAYRGSLELFASDGDHTAVRLLLRSHPQSVVSAFFEMVMPWMDRADQDLRKLAELAGSRA